MSEPTPLELAEIRAGIDVLTEDSYHQPWSDEWALEMKRDLYRVVAEVERLRAENAGLREREAGRRSKFSQVQPRVSVLEMLGCADDEPATLVLSPEIWCDVCGAWHIPTSCSAANAPSVASAGPVAANRPWLVRGDNHPADDAGEGQS